MKSLFVIAILAILLFSSPNFALAESEKCGNGICEANEIAEGCDPPEYGANPCVNLVYCLADCEEGRKTTEIKKAKIRDEEIETELVIKEEKENNQSKLKVNLSNGRKAEIKIMPETASARAIKRLGQLNFTIQLKEVGQGNQTKPIYEVQAERHYKLLWIFKAKAKVKAEVDAETGELIVIKKPWWAFLATG